MKIAYIHTGLWPSHSPSITFATLNAIGLAEVSEHCYFFIKRNSPNSSSEILKKYFNISQPKNLSIYQIKKKAIVNTNYFYFRRVYQQIKGLISHNELDVIISRNTTFLPYLAKLKERFGVPTFFETHDFYADLSIRDDINIKKKRKRSTYEQRYIPHISGVICLQKAQKMLYERYFPNQKFIIARTGIHLIKHSDISERKYLGYIGSLNAHKGVANLLQAAASSQTQPPILIIGGKSNKQIEEYYALAEKYYRKEKVEITGWVYRPQLEQYLTKVKIGVIPLQDTFFNRFLTSPLKLFDFYSYSIPVLSADLPTMRELVKENETGLFFNPDNPKELAQQIDFLYTHKDSLERMSEKIYTIAEKHLWKNRAQKLLDAIKNLNSSQSCMMEL